MRKIIVPSGIGDSIWLLQKLINAGEQFEFVLPNNLPQRGKQIFDLLPSIGKAKYGGKLTYKKIADNNVQKKQKAWKDIKEDSFYLSANEHLEKGRRIEDFLPDLETTFRIPWETSHFADKATELLPDGGRYIGIYASKYATVEAWGAWKEDKWMELIELIHEKDPEYQFVIIGAEYDIDLGSKLMERLTERDIPFVKIFGEELGLVIEVMKRLHYLFSFPSGMGILAPTVECPVTMFYPKHLELMMNAWAHPDDIASGQYKGCQFPEPKQIFDWCIEFGKL